MLYSKYSIEQWFLVYVLTREHCFSLSVKPSPLLYYFIEPLLFISRSVRRASFLNPFSSSPFYCSLFHLLALSVSLLLYFVISQESIIDRTLPPLMLYSDGVLSNPAGVSKGQILSIINLLSRKCDMDHVT